MKKTLSENLTVIAERVASAGHVLVGLDYDGTLTPLVDDPPQAILWPEVRDLLKTLVSRPGVSVAIISGRALDELRMLVGVDGLIYAGNHGLDISGPGLRFIEPTAITVQRAVGRLAAILAAGLAHIAGVVVEDNVLTISVHYRRVAPTKLDEIRRHVESVVAVAPHRFRVSLGSHVFEVRPQVYWHKGTAMCWIREQLGNRNALTLYLGGDPTDEDAFLALCDGVTVKVGKPSETLAHYHLETPADAKEFLLWLEHASAGRK